MERKKNIELRTERSSLQSSGRLDCFAHLRTNNPGREHASFSDLSRDCAPSQLLKGDSRGPEQLALRHALASSASEGTRTEWETQWASPGSCQCLYPCGKRRPLSLEEAGPEVRLGHWCAVQTALLGVARGHPCPACYRSSLFGDPRPQRGSGPHSPASPLCLQVMSAQPRPLWPPRLASECPGLQPGAWSLPSRQVISVNTLYILMTADFESPARTSP